MEDLFNIIVKCVYRVIDGEKVYERTILMIKKLKNLLKVCLQVNLRR